MNLISNVNIRVRLSTTALRYAHLLRSFFAGLLIPCGFAPIHLPGLALLGIALLFTQLNQQGLVQTQQTVKQSFTMGFVFGLGFLGLGVSWIYVSIHEYGHLNLCIAALITGSFVAYLALFQGFMAMVYVLLAGQRSLLIRCFLFSAVWCLSEFLRATLLGGFPWLLLGFGQIDTPLKYLLPIVGTYGTGLMACFAATLLAAAIQTTRSRYPWIIAFVLVLLAPITLKHVEWTTASRTPLSVSVIQANLSMRDKWDEALFWQLLHRYEQYLKPLIGKKQLIVMPESAIPVPSSYISDFLESIDQQAKQKASAVLMGIPQIAPDETSYFNTMSTFGLASGTYLKQHLVPFGEFIPQVFQPLNHWLQLPIANMRPGNSHQPLIRIHNHPVATLICYEVAFPELLRKQLPAAEWIVSISDDGWFGHSLAMYQQLQMSQALSMQTGRFQIVANNDGLSSIINHHGDIITSLPAFSAGVLDAAIYPMHGAPPWIYFGDIPTFLLCFLILMVAGLLSYHERTRS